MARETDMRFCVAATHMPNFDERNSSRPTPRASVLRSQAMTVSDHRVLVLSPLSKLVLEVRTAGFPEQLPGRFVLRSTEA